MSEKWTWNGVPCSWIASAAASTAANGSRPVKAPSLSACRCAKSSTGRTQPSCAAIAKHVLGRSEVAHPAHHLDAERHGAPLALEPLAQLAELLDDGGERLLARTPEQEAGVENDELGAGTRPRCLPSGRASRPPFGTSCRARVARGSPRSGHARRARCPRRARARRTARRTGSPSRTRPRSRSRTRCSRARGAARPPLPGSPGTERAPVRSEWRSRLSPSTGADVGGGAGLAGPGGSRARARAASSRSAGGVARSRARIAPRGSHGTEPGRADSNRATGHASAGVVRRRSYAVLMAKRPSRIELLELDIDLRLADLWREADEIDEWNLEIVAAFMRAAYGKGYCDALTEESPGELCHEHGYRVPPQASRDDPQLVAGRARISGVRVSAQSRARSSSRSRSPARSRSSCSTRRSPVGGTPTVKPSQLLGPARPGRSSSARSSARSGATRTPRRQRFRLRDIERQGDACRSSTRATRARPVQGRAEHPGHGQAARTASSSPSGTRC